MLKKEEGGRHTPFFNGYRPQFYFRTTDVTGTVTLPAGTEMVMPGDNIKVDVELVSPIACEEGLRFAIREGGKTVGAGVVTKILADALPAEEVTAAVRRGCRAGSAWSRLVAFGRSRRAAAERRAERLRRVARRRRRVSTHSPGGSLADTLQLLLDPAVVALGAVVHDRGLCDPSLIVIAGISRTPSRRRRGAAAPPDLDRRLQCRQLDPPAEHAAVDSGISVAGGTHRSR